MAVDQVPGRAGRVLAGRARPPRDRRDEQAQVIALLLHVVLIGYQHQLVVVRYPEPVDGSDPWSLASLAQLHPLDVPECPQCRIDLPGEHRGQQARADVRLLHAGGGHVRAREDGLQVGRLVGDAGGPDPLAAQVAHRPDAGLRVAITEVSGRWTSAATATTGSPCLRARNTSGSYEIARSVRPAATCLIGADGSEGTRGQHVEAHVAEVALRSAPRRSRRDPGSGTSRASGRARRRSGGR